MAKPDTAQPVNAGVLLRSKLIVSLILIIITSVVYIQVKDHEFINYDDDVYVTENSRVKTGLTAAGMAWACTSFHGANWHPLTWVSHMLDCKLFGPTPGRHHLMSLALHLLNSVLSR